MKLQQVLYLGPEDHKYCYHIAKPKEQTSETLSNIKEVSGLDIEPYRKETSHYDIFTRN